MKEVCHKGNDSLTYDITRYLAGKIIFIYKDHLNVYAYLVVVDQLCSNIIIGQSRKIDVRGQAVVKRSSSGESSCRRSRTRQV